LRPRDQGTGRPPRAAKTLISTSRLYGDLVATAWILHQQSGELAPAELPEALDTLGTDGTVVWLELSPEEFQPLTERLGFHPQAVEDALKAADGMSEAAQRTKLDRFPGHMFL